MHKIFKSLIIILILSFPFSLNVKAENITEINDLIENANELDGQEITIQGEAIGERMDRGDYSWINVNDGTNAIGVWVDKSKADEIKNYGNYDYVGDTIKITGIFHRACGEHGGEADLHNKSIKLLINGHSVKESISTVKIIYAVGLSALALSMLIIYKKMVI